MLIAIGLFALGSALCGSAQNMSWLISGRGKYCVDKMHFSLNPRAISHSRGGWRSHIFTLIDHHWRFCPSTRTRSLPGSNRLVRSKCLISSRHLTILSGSGLSLQELDRWSAGRSPHRVIGDGYFVRLIVRSSTVYSCAQYRLESPHLGHRVRPCPCILEASNTSRNFNGKAIKSGLDVSALTVQGYWMLMSPQWERDYHWELCRMRDRLDLGRCTIFMDIATRPCSTDHRIPWYMCFPIL